MYGTDTIRSIFFLVATRGGPFGKAAPGLIQGPLDIANDLYTCGWVAYLRRRIRMRGTTRKGRDNA